MTLISNPPSSRSIFQYPPNFPNGQVSDAWMAWFQEVQANNLVYPTPQTGFALGWDALGNLVNVPNTGADQTAAWTAADAVVTSAFQAADAVVAANAAAGTALVRSDLASKSNPTLGTALIGFLATSTGAVGRWLIDKLCDRLSIKDFGVAGDGTDETTKLQNAFNWLNTGKTLDCQGLTVEVTAPILVQSKSNFVVNGNGVTIKGRTGYTTSGDSQLLRFIDCTDFEVEGLNADGNRAGRTAQETPCHNIEFRSCHRFMARRVRSINAPCDGFIFDTATATDAATFCTDFTLMDCYADNCYRQGASFINAYDGKVIGGAYENTNGAPSGPWAGIDVESNAGAATPGDARLLFQGVRFAGNAGPGLLLTSISGAKQASVRDCYFKSNTLSGIQINCPGVSVDGCKFEGHGATVLQGVVWFGTGGSYGKVTNCDFSGNTGAASNIYTRSDTVRNLVSGNSISGGVLGIALGGESQTCTGNAIADTTGTGIDSSCYYSDIAYNKIKAAVAKGIYAGGQNNRVAFNNIRDIVTPSPGYIQDAGKFNTIVFNLLQAAAPSSDIAVYVNGTNPSTSRVMFNDALNLNTTDSYTFTTASGDDATGFNSGGSARDFRLADTLGSKGYTTAQRNTLGATLPIGACVYDTTLSKPVWLNNPTGPVWKDAAGTTV